MLPLLPIIVVSLIGATAYKVHKKNTSLTPQQKMILDTALNKKLASADYLKLADSFEAEGFKAEATLLRNRAAFQDAPEAKKAEWRAAFRKAFTSEDPTLVTKMALAFQKQGATGAAADLHKYAQGLKDGTATPTVLPAVPVTGNGGPSIVTTPPAVIPVPPATPSATANSTTTPTVPLSTGATTAIGDTTSSMNQGAPPPVSAPPLSPAAALIAVIPPNVVSPALAPVLGAAASAATAASPAAANAINVAAGVAGLASTLASSVNTAVNVAATPTVTTSAGSTTTPNDATSSMNQGSPTT